MPAKLDLTGRQFGRLTVIKELKTRKHGCIVWLCQCQCGNKTSVCSSSLTSFSTQSCGCYRREKASQLANQTCKIHGDGGRNPTRLYNIWHGMKKRCSNKNDKDYKRYGGRGIKVCKIWHDYRAFKKWALEHGYCEGLEIDRTNNDGNYCPSNCRWVTRKENLRNTRRTRWFTIKGKTKSLIEWCEIYCERYDVSYHTVHARLARGWKIIDALTKPLHIS